MPLQEPIEPDPNERPRKYPDENKWVWDAYYRLKKTIEDALEPLSNYHQAFNVFLPVLKSKPDDYARELELEDPPRDFESIKEEVIKARQKEE